MTVTKHTRDIWRTSAGTEFATEALDGGGR
jgi:hypothetical protein